MNLRKLFVVVLLGLGCAVAVQAQVGVYVGYTATRLSGIQCLSSAAINCSNGMAPGATGAVNPSGIQGGAYYDFKTYGPVRLGVDVRGGDYHSNKSASTSGGGKNFTGMDNVLFGVKGSVHTKFEWLNPYAQMSVGYARTNATEPNNNILVSSDGIVPPRTEDSFLMYEFFAGVSIKVFPVIDLRPIELGIGNMNRVGSGSGSSSVGVQSIGASIVFHMP